MWHTLYKVNCVRVFSIIILFYRKHDRQEPVAAHEDERVDGHVGGDVDQVLHCLAPDQPEGPVVENVVRGGEGHAQHDEEQVGHRQVEDEDVGGVAHLLVGGNHKDHQSVADYAWKSFCITRCTPKRMIDQLINLIFKLDFPNCICISLSSFQKDKMKAIREKDSQGRLKVEI